MNSVAWDPSNLAVYFKDGAVCTSCCVAGEDCEHCDVATPATITVEVSGLTDIDEGVCQCFQTGEETFRSGKFEGIPASLINNVEVECEQQAGLPCRYLGYLRLESASRIVYENDCTPLDCTGAIETTYKLCYVTYLVVRRAAAVEIQLFISGEIVPGADAGRWDKVFCGQPWELGLWESISAPGTDCMCVEQEGGFGLYWDMASGTIRIWSALCPTMHVNDVTAGATGGGCGGDEEKLQVSVTIHDSDDIVLENAHVEITLTDDVDDVVYADTNEFGVATYTSDCLCINGNIGVEVTKITKGGYIWNSGDDEDSLTDSVSMDCV